MEKLQNTNQRLNNPYNVLAINPGHNGSCAFTSDGQLIYYCEEERLSRMKYDGNPFRAMLNILVNYRVDELVLGGTMPNFVTLPWTNEDAYTALVRKFNPDVKVTNLAHLHHLSHATAAFYGSGFDTAAAVIVDGAGSIHSEEYGDKQQISGFETETIYQCGYPHEFTAVYKRYSGQPGYYNNGIQEFDDSVTITKAYEAVSYYLGFGFIEAGKTMGLAPYGQPDPNIPKFFIEGKGNKNLLIPRYPAGAHIDENRFNYLRRFNDPKMWHTDFELCREVDKNLAWHVQNDTEEMMYALIQRAIETTGETNIVISGGFGLNCVANYKYLKRFPECKFYIDPVAHDGGTAIGLARYAWYKFSNSTEREPLTTVYLGANPDYNQVQSVLNQVPGTVIEDATVEQVAELLIDQKTVALFQGRAEGGPRALGNRSLLFDPRAKNGKEIVNRVKQREWFRPFAGSVLEEHAAEWFDMAGLTSSPFMMYAVDVLPEKVSVIPAVSHVDNTCRVQTVNRDQNPAYYDLISKFHEKTGVPVIMNTSLNLAGQPLVDSVFDAFVVLLNSDIDYLYLPDVGKLVSKPKQ
jgi:carbamoyltransferase